MNILYSLLGSKDPKKITCQSSAFCISQTVLRLLESQTITCKKLV